MIFILLLRLLHFKVMGLMLGEFIDEYTVNVIDVFAMPQSGTVNIFLLKYFNIFNIFKIFKIFN